MWALGGGYDGCVIAGLLHQQGMGMRLYFGKSANLVTHLASSPETVPCPTTTPSILKYRNLRHPLYPTCRYSRARVRHWSRSWMPAWSFTDNVNYHFDQAQAA